MICYNHFLDCSPFGFYNFLSSVYDIFQCYTKVFMHYFATYSIFLKILFIYFREEKGGEKERERNINVWLPLTQPLLGTWPAAQACALTGNWTSDPLVCRLVLNPLSHTSQSYSNFFIPITHLTIQSLEISLYFYCHFLKLDLTFYLSGNYFNILYEINL